MSKPIEKDEGCYFLKEDVKVGSCFWDSCNRGEFVVEGRLNVFDVADLIFVRYYEGGPEKRFFVTDQFNAELRYGGIVPSLFAEKNNMFEPGRRVYPS